LDFTGACVDRQLPEARQAHEHVATDVVFAEAEREPIPANAVFEVQVRHITFSVEPILVGCDAELHFDLVPFRGREDQLSGAVLDVQALDAGRVEAMTPSHFIRHGRASSRCEDHDQRAS
jgi:hypothetical protein